MVAAAGGRLIVCGWCGPHQAAAVERLEAFGVPHDFVEVAAPETAARTRPLLIRDAMDRHPGKTILFLDAGCRIVGTAGDFARLVAVDGDIAFHARTALAPDGGPVFEPQPATLVVRPTAKAHFLVSEWIRVWEGLPSRARERVALTIALGRVPELSVTLLGREFCAVAGDGYPLPAILHEPEVAQRGGGGRLARAIGRIRIRR